MPWGDADEEALSKAVDAARWRLDRYSDNNELGTLLQERGHFTSKLSSIVWIKHNKKFAPHPQIKNKKKGGEERLGGKLCVLLLCPRWDSGTCCRCNWFTIGVIFSRRRSWRGLWRCFISCNSFKLFTVVRRIVSSFSGANRHLHLIGFAVEILGVVNLDCSSCVTDGAELLASNLNRYRVRVLHV